MRRGQLAPGAGLKRPPGALGRKSTAGLLGSLPRESRPGRAPTPPAMKPSLAEAFATAPCPGGGEPQQRLVLDNLTDAELKALAQALQERERCHNFIRLHPTRNTVERYAQIASWRGLAPKPGQAGRSPSSRCSHLLAALLFGPPPMRCSLGAALSAASDPSSMRSGSASVPSLLQSLDAQPAPLRLETLAPLRNAELPLGSFGRAGSGTTVATDGSPPKELEEPTLLPARKHDAWMSPTSTDTSVSPGSPSRQGDTFDGHGSFRRALEAVKELGMRDGCRVVLMEYLVRLAEVCTSLGSADAARLPQATFARLNAFQKRLSRSARPSSVGKLSAHCEREHSGSPHHPPADGAGSVEELAVACKACLATLQRDAQPEPSKPPALLPAGGPLPAVVGREDSASSVARYLPAAITQSAVGQRILVLLPRLSALELERVLADPRCDPEFRTLLDPAGAERASSHRSSSPSIASRRRHASRSISGRLEPRRVLWGPLSELMQSQAGPDAARERPSTESRRCRSLRSERSEETPATSFERLTGSWTRLAQKSDDPWQTLSLPMPPSPKATPMGLHDPASELPAWRRHRAVSDHLLLEAVTSTSAEHRVVGRARPSLAASVWARDIEL